MHSKFIDDSELSKVLVIGNLSIASLQTTVITVTDVKGARYALQASVCAVFQKRDGGIFHDFGNANSYSCVHPVYSGEQF